VRLYSTGYLVFGVKIPRHLEEGLEVSDSIRNFNLENGASLGYLTAGSFEDDSLYLVTYCEGVEPGEKKYVAPRAFSRKQRIAWKRQIEKFLRESSFEALDAVGLRMIADLDN
jgi:hypothetical protein